MQPIGRVSIKYLRLELEKIYDESRECKGLNIRHVEMRVLCNGGRVWWSKNFSYETP
ncbi:hypothetical protein FACS189465_0610 [Clostridia bacterium]|nr:hypothetical protein FACS189465_0610 [Clostridia bacterium]